MFLDNKYTKTYYRIVDKSRLQSRKKYQGIYYEKHHIIPKFMKGTNDKSNLVLLTAKEHFIVHLLLTKMFQKSSSFYYKAIQALDRMSVSSTYHKRFYSKVFEKIRIEKSKSMSGKNNPRYGKGLFGEFNHMYGKTDNLHPRFGILHTEVTKDKISKSNKGKLQGDKNPSKRLEVREKISKKKKGVPNSKLRLGNNPTSKLTDSQRIEIILDWDKHIGTLYSFAQTKAKEYNVSRGCIQNVFYPKEKLEENRKLLFS